MAECAIIGLLSAGFESMYLGIVIQSVGLIFGALAVLVYLYSLRIIKVTEQLRIGIVAATGAIFLIYVISWVLSFF